MAILRADGEHLMKLVVRNADRVGGVAGGRVLNSAHTDVEVAALDGLIDLVERHLNEFGLTAEALGDLAGDFDVESAQLRGIARISLHERRAAFGIAAPAKGRQGYSEQKKEDRHCSGIIGPSESARNRQSTETARSVASSPMRSVRRRVSPRSFPTHRAA